MPTRGYRTHGHYMHVAHVAIPRMTIPCMAIPRVTIRRVAHDNYTRHVCSMPREHKHVTEFYRGVTRVNACKNEVII